MSQTPQPCSVLLHGAAFGNSGEPLYLLGNDCIEFLNLSSYIDWLVRPRFLRLGQIFPGKDMKPAEQSSLQIRVKETTPEAILDQLRSHVESQFNRFQLSANDHLKFKLKKEDCCKSPCFGCVVYQAD